MRAPIPRSPPAPAVSSPTWTSADSHLLVAAGLVLLFTAQRLTGCMTLWLYRRLSYEHLVILAHLLGGAAFIVVGTLGASGVPMRLRAVPVGRVVVAQGWWLAAGGVLLLWWLSWPGLRPESLPGLAVLLVGGGVVLWWLGPPLERVVAAQRRPEWWRRGLLPAIWLAYSSDWELRLNFMKDDLAAARPGVQWEQIATDWAGVGLGLAWVAWVVRRYRARVV